MKINYKEQKLISEETKTKEELSVYIQKTDLELQSALLATQQSVIETELKLADAKTEYPLNIEKVLGLTAELESLKNGIECIEKLRKEYGFSK